MTDKPTSHTLYGTRSRPRLLDRTCPGCGARMTLVKDSERDWREVDGTPVILVGDGGGTWKRTDWRGRCNACLRELHGLAYQDLPPPFYVDQQTGIWAWNRDHLEHLCRVFAGQADADDPYAFFDNYLPRNWLRRKDKTLRALRRLREYD